MGKKSNIKKEQPKQKKGIFGLGSSKKEQASTEQSPSEKKEKPVKKPKLDGRKSFGQILADVRESRKARMQSIKDGQAE